MDTRNPNDDNLDSGALLWGFILGLIGGGLVALFRVPRIGYFQKPQLSSGGTETGISLREKLERALTPADPIADSIAEGKAAARRRRTELGLDA